MDRWLIYFKERFSLLNYLILISGLSLSGLVIRYGSPSLFPFLFSIVGLFLFFALYRIMDDTKDFEIDRLAHPHRPLPKVLFSIDEFKISINLLQMTMFAFAIIVWIFFSQAAGMTYLVIAVYLWHMYREFYISDWLTRKPITYAITHFIIIVPLALFPVALSRPNFMFSFFFLSYAFMIFASFFTYDICRKFDPNAHPIQKTYRQYHGFNKTLLLVIATLLISAIGASVTGMHHLLWPIELAVLISLCIIYFDQSKWGLVQGTATASLFIHAWAGMLLYLKNLVI